MKTLKHGQAYNIFFVSLKFSNENDRFANGKDALSSIRAYRESGYRNKVERAWLFYLIG
jgi:uncharacterized protein (UPF0548 family)